MERKDNFIIKNWFSFRTFLVINKGKRKSGFPDSFIS